MIELNAKVLINVLEVTEKTAFNKLKGRTQFTLPELIKLRNYYGTSFDAIIQAIEYRQTAI